MESNNLRKTIILLLCGLIVFGGVALIVTWLNSVREKNVSTITDNQKSNEETVTLLPFAISEGNKILINDQALEQKQEIAQDLAAGRYEQGIAKLTQLLQENPNHPEALIYLNNAKIANQTSYTLAVAIPSGSNINGAKEILRGVAQAQQEINQSGGIKGTPLKILIANDHNNPQTAQTLAQELAKNPEVLGVVGHWASDVTLAAAAVYQQEKMVAISPISTSVELSPLGDYIFRTVPSDRFAGSGLSRYMINQLNKQKAAIFFNSQSNYSQSLKDEFTKSLFSDGGKVVGEFDLSDANFNAVNDWQQAKERGAEVLMLALTSNTLNQGLDVIAVNKQQLPLLAGDDAYDPKILQEGGFDAQGMVLAIPWHILAHNNEPFVKASRELWRAEVNWRTALAHDATLAFIVALEQTPNPTRKSIQAVLSDPNFVFEGASGTIRFLPSGDRNQAVQLVTIKFSDRSDFGYNFELILD